MGEACPCCYRNQIEIRAAMVVGLRAFFPEFGQDPPSAKFIAIVDSRAKIRGRGVGPLPEGDLIVMTLLPSIADIAKMGYAAHSSRFPVSAIEHFLVHPPV